MSTEHRSAASAARHGIMNGAVLAFAVVTGCAVGPDYHAPELTVPARYSESGVHASVGTSLAEWWRVFHDTPLDRLVERAIDANLDLRIAEARVRESRALRGIARSALWPTEVPNLTSALKRAVHRLSMLVGVATADLFPRFSFWPTIATAAGLWIFSMCSRRSARSTRRRPSWREASAPPARISSDCTRRSVVAGATSPPAHR
jgi:hypothetical protein